MKVILPLFLLGILLAVIWGVDYGISKSVKFAEPVLNGNLTDLQTKQVEIYVAMNQQLMGLGTFVLAGLGALFFYIYFEGRKTLMGVQRAMLVGSMLLAAFSIYMGYLSYDKMVWMLSQKFFNLDTPLLYWVRTLQFWSFIGSILLFLWFGLTEIQRK